ncbi:MAG: hypothetical protein MUF03_13710, partial [Rubrivivax sp.]|nr:hypothetical protein [Rubrivivax sp.]
MTPSLIDAALRGPPRGPSPMLAPLPSLVVAGAGGTLGAALLAEALAAGRFRRVQAVVHGPMASTMRGFEALPVARLDDTAGAPLDAEVAIVVFERGRRANGRDDAFLRPEPRDLPGLAAALRRGGVRRLLVVVPHAAALLPSALKHGFASSDEAALAALDFEHVVIVRSAQSSAPAAGRVGRLQRFAGWWLSQLAWMIPRREQALRSQLAAPLLVTLARRLAGAPPGTRVIAPE